CPTPLSQLPVPPLPVSARDSEHPRPQPSRIRSVLVRAARAEAYAALPSRQPAPPGGQDRVPCPESGLPDRPRFLDAVLPEPHPGDETVRQAASGRHRLVQPRSPACLVSVRAGGDPGAPRVVDVWSLDRLPSV